MRGFMRSIGLGGLFRRSRGSSGAASATFRPIANPFIAVLEEKSDTSPASRQMRTSASQVLIEPVRDSRTSSVADERPQFLFFCGSESTGARTPSLSSARMNATLKQQQQAVAARPVISHRMPVFFSAHCAFPPTVSPTSMAGRPSASIFN